MLEMILARWMITYHSDVWRWLQAQDYLDERDLAHVLAETTSFLLDWKPEHGNHMANDFVKVACGVADPQQVAAHLVMEFKVRKGLDTLKEA